MEALAVAIFLSTVLFLVDRNQKWPVFWSFVRRGTLVIIGVAVLGASWYAYGRYRTNHAPETLPAGFSNWDK